MNHYNSHYHRRSIRLKGYDYSSEGLYFITICCQHHACLFGDIIESEMILNKYGIIAHKAWLNTVEIRPEVELGEFIIMPNHIHAIVRISGRGVSHTPHDAHDSHTPHDTHDSHTPHDTHDLHTPHDAHDSYTPHDTNDLQTIRCSHDSHPPCKINNLRTSHKFNIATMFDGLQPHFGMRVCDTPLRETTPFYSGMGVCDTPLRETTPFRSPSKTIGAIVRGYKSAVTKQLNMMNIGCIVWQRNYYEIIIRNEQSYDRIANYIVNNPAKWFNDKFFIKNKTDNIII